MTPGIRRLQSRYGVSLLLCSSPCCTSNSRLSLSVAYLLPLILSADYHSCRNCCRLSYKFYCPLKSICFQAMERTCNYLPDLCCKIGILMVKYNPSTLSMYKKLFLRLQFPWISASRVSTVLRKAIRLYNRSNRI